MTRTHDAELRADTIALLRATIRDDMPTVYAIADDSEHNAALFRSLVSFGWLLGGSTCGDLEAFDAFLANLQTLCVASLTRTER